MQILRKSLLYRQFVTKSDKNHYFKCKYEGNCYFAHSLWCNLIKNVTLNVNTKEIITLQTVTLDANTKEPPKI